MKQRREIPLRMQENVKKLVGHDLNRLRVLEGGDGEGFEFAEEEVKEDVDDDKKFGPGKKEAAELFGQARKDLEKLLVVCLVLTLRRRCALLTLGLLGLPCRIFQN